MDEGRSSEHVSNVFDSTRKEKPEEILSKVIVSGLV